MLAFFNSPVGIALSIAVIALIIWHEVKNGKSAKPKKTRLRPIKRPQKQTSKHKTA